MNRIITTLDDIDLYKITMGHFVNQHFPEAWAKYRLTLRSPVKFTQQQFEEIQKELMTMNEVSFSEASTKHLQ